MSEEELARRFHQEFAAYRAERNRRLHRFMVKVIAIFALLGACVSVTAYYVYQISKDNQAGLCAIRHDSERRVALGDKFLKEHPNGFAGISVDSLKRSTNNAKETVRSLAELDCPPLPKEDVP